MNEEKCECSGRVCSSDTRLEWTDNLTTNSLLIDLLFFQALLRLVA